jgi:hypothetical protein
MATAIQALQAWDVCASFTVHAMHGYSRLIPPGLGFLREIEFKFSNAVKAFSAKLRTTKNPIAANQNRNSDTAHTLEE